MADEPVKKPEIKEIATAAKDIDIFAGYLKRLENPDPVLLSESTGKGIKLYDEVDRDAHAGSVFQTRYLAVVNKEWQVDPGQPSADRRRPTPEEKKAQEIADFVKQVLLSCNFDQARQEMLQGILYGFYGAEVMWEYSNGKILVNKILAKHPRRFIFTPERELRLLTPSSMIEGEPVPDRKFVTFTYGSSDNPYGKGLGQKCWWPVWFKKHGIKFWVIFAEKFGAPTPWGKYPSGTKKEDQDKLLVGLAAMQQESAIITPDGMLIELIEAARQSSVNTYESLCEFMDKQISKAVLGHTASAEATPGKLGSEDQAVEIRADYVKADADLLAECLNATLIRWIVDFNFGPQPVYPKFWVRTEPEKDLKSLADRDKVLVREIGVPAPKRYFYETYDIPEPEEGEEIITPPAAGPLPMFSERSRARGIAPLQFIELSPEQEAAMEATRQRLIGQYMREARISFGGIRAKALDEIESALLGSSGMSQTEFGEKIRAILLKHYGASAEDLAPVVERAMEPIFTYYRVTDKSAWGGAAPAVSMSFDPVDRATLDAMRRIDTAYLSKYIENQDMQGPVMKFLQGQYGEKGEGLFGRGSAEGIAQFRQQFAGQLEGLEDWQIRRILDTSVTRMRSYADVRQGVQGGVDMRVHVTRGERACDICRPRHGEIIPAQAMQARMDTAARKPEVFGTFNDVPPFHPNCVCRLLMNL